jgi:uracil-DNA glycosylase
VSLAADLEQVLTEARACTVCAAHLPLGPLPLERAGHRARVLIISQAPGTKAHASDLSFNDPSGDRLRGWLGVDRATFYDPECMAILPMGFCYPGRLPKGGDAPPRPECAPLWHARILAALPDIELTLYVGSYAIHHYLPGYKTMTAAVADWRSHAPDVLPLPHQSWRTNAWERKNPWFTDELLPVLRQRMRQSLAG